MRTVSKTSFHAEALNQFENEADRRILIVHDVDRERNGIADFLANEYVCTTAASVQEALAHLALDEYALIILNPQMVLFDEEYFHHYFRNLYPDIAVIFIGQGRVDLSTEGLIHISRSSDRASLALEVSRVLNLRKAVTELKNSRMSNERIARENEHAVAQLKVMKAGIVQMIARLLKTKDEARYRRSLCAGEYADLLSEAYSLNDELRNSLSVAVLIRELDQSSVLEFLNECDSFSYALEIVRFERENFDGTGSPMGLSGFEIPIASRILRVAVEFASEGKSSCLVGSELDPQVVDCLTRLIGKEDRVTRMGLPAISNSDQISKVATKAFRV